MSTKDDLRISLRDFVKIFKSDKVSERITLMIKKAVQEETAQNPYA
jgi:hypothetical protein